MKICKDSAITWVKAHNYPYKIVDNKLYWITTFQCAEEDLDTGDIIWHDIDFFFKKVLNDNDEAIWKDVISFLKKIYEKVDNSSNL